MRRGTINGYWRLHRAGRPFSDWTEMRERLSFRKDGNTYFSQSQGIYRSVLDIYDMFPDFNAPDGITVAVKQTPLGGGRSTKSLEIK